MLLSVSPSAVPPLPLPVTRLTSTPLRGILVGRGVAPGAAIDGVGAAATLDHVMAAAGENLVGAVIADDHVGAVGDAVVVVEHFARVDLCL